MTDAPTVVGINRTQDASICVATGPSTVYSLQKERLSRRKHHWGRLGDLRQHYAPALPALSLPVDLVVECYSSDLEVEHDREYHDELMEVLRFRGEPRVERVSHHLAHAYSAFHPSPFSEAAVLVIDAQGSRVKDFVETLDTPSELDPMLLEVASFYVCEGGRIRCLGKQLWDGDWDRPHGLGCFYSLLTRAIFPGEGNEGKVMGLAPFGRADAFDLPPLEVTPQGVDIPSAWLDVLAQADRFTFFQNGRGSFDLCADLAAAGQRTFEEAVLVLADWLHHQSGMADLCFVGGTALNCSANGRLLRESPFDHLFIPPSPHDGGTALGSALYGMIRCLDTPSQFRWEHDFLGPETDPAAVAAAVGSAPDDLVIERPDDLVAAVVDLLDGGCVVGLHQGRSESGPRALGNRSIIADARHPGMQDFINFKVKGREWFRPLAPLVLLESAPEIFDIDRPAPFMQIATDVRPEHRQALPAITHVDGSARLQTVEERTTPFLYALMKGFEARTGCPVLLNTSLNGQGQPLVESPAESIEVLRTTEMHALAMPPYLLRKREMPPPPPRSQPDSPDADRGLSSG